MPPVMPTDIEPNVAPLNVPPPTMPAPNPVQPAPNQAPASSPSGNPYDSMSTEQLEGIVKSAYQQLNQVGAWRDPQNQQVGHQVRGYFQNKGQVIDPTQGGAVSPTGAALPGEPVQPAQPTQQQPGQITRRDPALVKSIIQSFVTGKNPPPSHLSPDDQQQVIAGLQAQGITAHPTPDGKGIIARRMPQTRSPGDIQGYVNQIVQGGGNVSLPPMTTADQGYLSSLLQSHGYQIKPQPGGGFSYQRTLAGADQFANEAVPQAPGLARWFNPAEFGKNAGNDLVDTVKSLGALPAVIGTVGQNAGTTVVNPVMAGATSLGAFIARQTGHPEAAKEWQGISDELINQDAKAGQNLVKFGKAMFGGDDGLVAHAGRALGAAAAGDNDTAEHQLRIMFAGVAKETFDHPVQQLLNASIGAAALRPIAAARALQYAKAAEAMTAAGDAQGAAKAAALANRWTYNATLAAKIASLGPIGRGTVKFGQATARVIQKLPGAAAATDYLKAGWKAANLPVGDLANKTKMYQLFDQYAIRSGSSSATTMRWAKYMRDKLNNPKSGGPRPPTPETGPGETPPPSGETLPPSGGAAVGGGSSAGGSSRFDFIEPEGAAPGARGPSSTGRSGNFVDLDENPAPRGGAPKATGSNRFGHIELDNIAAKPAADLTDAQLDEASKVNAVSAAMEHDTHGAVTPKTAARADEIEAVAGERGVKLTMPPEMEYVAPQSVPEVGAATNATEKVAAPGASMAGVGVAVNAAAPEAQQPTQAGTVAPGQNPAMTQQQNAPETNSPATAGVSSPQSATTPPPEASTSPTETNSGVQTQPQAQASAGEAKPVFTPAPLEQQQADKGVAPRIRTTEGHVPIQTNEGGGYWKNVTYANGQSSFVKVDGQKAIIPGYENIDAFLHRDDTGQWNVYDAMTGRLLGWAAVPTMAKSIAARQLKRDGFDVNGAAKQIADNAVKDGVSPRYSWVPAQDVIKERAAQKEKENAANEVRGGTQSEPQNSEAENVSSTTAQREAPGASAGSAGAGEHGVLQSSGPGVSATGSRGAGTASLPKSSVGKGSAGTRSEPGTPEPGSGGESSGHETEHPRREHASDYRYKDVDQVGGSGFAAKAQNLLDAIKLVRQLERDNRNATPEEQEVLSAFPGWGWTGNALSPTNDEGGYGTATLLSRVKQYMTAKEMVMAKSSTMNSHYTDPRVVAAMWSGMRRLGFTGGKVLEPSAGAGFFVGFCPDDIHAASTFRMIEKDGTTAKIAENLYPEQNVQHASYQQVKLPSDYFDATIGNVPFGKLKIVDERFKNKLIQEFGPIGVKVLDRVHNYFLAKMLDQTRPGGIMMAITSHGSLDANDQSARITRQYLAAHGNLLAAIRLPNNAFKGQASTSVTTDILIFQKHGNGVEKGGEQFLNVAPAPTSGNKMTESTVRWNYRQEHDGEHPTDEYVQKAIAASKNGKVDVNEYFVRHPEMVMGEHSDQGKMNAGRSKGEYTTQPFEGEDYKALANRIEAAMASLPANVIKPWVSPVVESVAEPTAEKSAPRQREGTLVVKKNVVYVTDYSGREIKKEADARESATIGAYVVVRNMLFDLVEMEKSDASKEDMDRQRGRLKAAYTAYEKAYGPLHGPSKKLWAQDPDVAAVLGLEHWDAKNKRVASLAPIFSGRVIHSSVEATTAETAKDALSASLRQYGRINSEYMQNLTGKSEAEVMTDLLTEGLAYYDPDIKTWITRDEYGSDNVRAKLRAAEQAAEEDPAYEANVKFLKTVQPKTLVASEIGVKVGAPWVPVEYVREFAEYLLDWPHSETGKISYAPSSASWQVLKPRNGGNSQNTQKWGIEEKPAYELLKAAMNGSSPTVWYPKERGETSPRQNVEATQAANAKMQAIRDEWVRWVFRDNERAEFLVNLYNSDVNVFRKREFDGSHLTFPGMNKTVLAGGELRTHQANAVWRAIVNKTAYFGHDVGTGKTYTIAATAMELRRLGMRKKPCCVTMRNTVPQIAADFIKLYPGARIFQFPEIDSPLMRQEAMAKVMTGDWDCVIMNHDSLKLLPVSPETQVQFFENMIEELQLSYEELVKSGAEDYTVKQLQKKIENIAAKREAQMAKLNDRQDDGIYWEDLGIDQLFVDEAQVYKNLNVESSRQGMSVNGSEIAQDLFMKTRELLARGGGLVMASGTPITNSIAELHTVMRYVAPHILKQQKIEHFDAWAQMFADTENVLQRDVAGRYKKKTMFTKFSNVPEMLAMYNQVMDAVLAEDIPDLILPSLLNEKGDVTGEPIVVKCEVNNAQKSYFYDMVQRALAIHGRPEKGDDTMLSISTDGRMVSLDARLRMKDAPDYETSKINQVINKVVAEHKRPENMRDRRTQLIFCDLGLPGENEEEYEDAETGQIVKRKVPKFNLYADMVRKLVKQGIPREQIAVIQEITTDEGRASLFAEVNAGNIRVMIGSRQRMGVGTNVQKRLVAIHQVDPTWRPDQMQQADGRILRQGNDFQAQGVRIYQYVTVGSYDEFMWTKLATKAGFIKEVTKGDVNAREIEDIEGKENFSFSQMQAIASGNPLLMEYQKLKDKQQLLLNLEKNHNDQRIAASTKARAARHSIQKFTADIGYLKDYLKWRDENTPTEDKQNLVVSGVSFDSNDGFNSAMAAQLEKFNAYFNSEHFVGNFGGYKLYIKAVDDIARGNRMFKQKQIVIKTGNPVFDTIRVYAYSSGLFGTVDEVPFKQGEKVYNYVAAIMRQIRGSGDSELLYAERQVAEFSKEAPKLEEEAKAPFAKVAEVEAIPAKLHELEEALGIKSSSTEEDNQTGWGGVGKDDQELRDIRTRLQADIDRQREKDASEPDDSKDFERVGLPGGARGKPSKPPKGGGGGADAGPGEGGSSPPPKPRAPRGGKLRASLFGLDVVWDMIRSAIDKIRAWLEKPVNWEAAKEREMAMADYIQAGSEEDREAILEAIAHKQNLAPEYVDELRDIGNATVLMFEEFGQQLVDLKLMTRETFEKQRGAYLHRIYDFFEDPEKWMEGLEARLWQEAKDQGLDGALAEDFVRQGQGQAQLYRNAVQGIHGGGTSTTAGVRGPIPKAVVKHRGATEETRGRLGEIPLASSRVAVGGVKASRAIAKAQLMRDLAKEFGKTEAAVADLGAKEARNYVKVSHTEGFGNLSNRYVPRWLYKELKYLTGEETNWDSALRRIMSAWKSAHTSYNPGTFFSNAAGYAMLSDLAGLPVITKGGTALADETLKDMIEHGRWMDEAKQFTNYYHDSTDRGALREFVRGAYPETTGAQIKWRAKELAKAPSNLYTQHDMFFKHRMYIAARTGRFDAAGRIFSPEEANTLVENSFPSWRNGTPIIAIRPAVQRLRSTWLPFISWDASVVPLIYRAFRDNPGRIGRYPLLANAYALYVRDHFGQTEEDADNEKKTIPDYYNRLGYTKTDELDPQTGNPIYQAPGGFNPFLSFGNAEDPASLVVERMNFGLTLLYEFALNADALTKQKINKPGMTFGEQAEAYAKITARAVVPPVLPGGYEFDKMQQAATGFDKRGRPITPTQREGKVLSATLHLGRNAEDLAQDRRYKVMGYLDAVKGTRTAIRNDARNETMTPSERTKLKMERVKQLRDQAAELPRVNR